MKIEINGESETALRNNEIKKIVKKVLDIFEVKRGEVELIFVNLEEIQKLNFKHRLINKPTDVLSFPQFEIKNINYKVLGSIIICPEIVTKKHEEMSDVIKHGLLHLLGYDHETNEQEWEQGASKINCNL